MNLNRVLYFGDFFVCPAAILILAAIAIVKGDFSTIGLWVAAFVIGCGVWTLVEYTVHRWLYHNVAFFDKLHDLHHDDPTSLIGAPSFIAIGVIFLLFYLPFYFINYQFAGGFTSGILVGYFAYMLVHHASHHWTLTPGTLLYRLRMAHMAHHFHAEEANFGIITMFWDKLFGTYVERPRNSLKREMEASH